MAEKTRDYVVGGIIRYTMPTTSCLFCAHCTDIFYDYDGIYMIFCNERDTDQVWDFGVHGKCDTFEPDGTEIEVTNDAQG